jgi:hypothetical protein
MCVSIYVKMNSVDVNSYHPSTDTYLFVKVTKNGHEEHVVIDEETVELEQDNVGAKKKNELSKIIININQSINIYIYMCIS